MPKRSDEITNLDQIKSLPSALPFCHPDYRHPTPSEVGALIRLVGLSQRKTALIVGVRSDDSGSSTVRRWKTDISSKEYREIPYAAWRLLLEYSGAVTVKEVRDALKEYW
jgi:hypothetical protein